MKNTFGNSVSVTLFGESHGEVIGAVTDGLAPGIKIDEDYIALQLSRRTPSGKISTARHEKDDFRIVSGVFNGMTTGAPITILMENTQADSRDYDKNRGLARPSHADYAAYSKYHGYEDYRGGGHFSGRLTAPLVASGAILLSALKAKGITVATHIKKCAGISDAGFTDPANEGKILETKSFPVLDEEAGERMRLAAEEAAKNGDSVGGILETAVCGLPAGLGEPWFDSFESVLSHGLFSIPAVKGAEFGAGFALADMKGSEANDPFYTENGVIRTKTNRSGGVNGGITNGMPVLFRTVIKPASSISLPQETVDFFKNENAVLTLDGRHDPCIVHRAAPVQDAVTAFVLADLLTLRYGTDHLR